MGASHHRQIPPRPPGLGRDLAVVARPGAGGLGHPSHGREHRQDAVHALHARYAKAFAQFPQNKAVLKSRIAVGNTVVDHELVIRAPGGEQFEIIAIYTFKDGLISRVDFAK